MFMALPYVADRALLWGVRGVVQGQGTGGAVILPPPSFYFTPEIIFVSNVVVPAGISY